MNKLSLISNISCKKNPTCGSVQSDSRSISPTFENKLTAINKDLEKLPGVSTVVLYKDELLF